jgi:uncharacterized protein YbjT (DUF2867 family)
VSLVTLAREAGAEQFVYTSFPPLAASFPLQDAKRAVERALRASGLTYTILQPTYFRDLAQPCGRIRLPQRQGCHLRNG